MREVLRLTRASVFLLSWLGILIAACHRDLPDAQGYGARLYAARCGQCHAPYDPASLTASMWEVQMQAMEARMQQAGMPALTDTERRTILDYLQQHAEH